MQSVGAAMKRMIERTRRNLRNTRDLRADMLELAAELAAAPDKCGVLRVIAPAIADATAQSVWDNMLVAFRPELIARMRLVIESEEDGRLLEREAAATSIAIERANFRYEVLRNLLNAGFRSEALQTSAQMQREIDASQTPVRDALKSLIAIHGLIETWPGGMRVKPEAVTRDVLTRTRSTPQTLRFRFERGAHIKPAETLLGRVHRLAQEDKHPPAEKNGSFLVFRLSGTAVAQRAVPAINLVGTPRMDLVLHLDRSASTFDAEQMRRLDDGLEYEPDVLAPAPVVVTVVRSPPPEPTGRPSGDVDDATPADVFLSLIDLGFREQALEYAQGVKA